MPPESTPTVPPAPPEGAPEKKDKQEEIKKKTETYVQKIEKGLAGPRSSEALPPVEVARRGVPIMRQAIASIQNQLMRQPDTTQQYPSAGRPEWTSWEGVGTVPQRNIPQSQKQLTQILAQLNDVGLGFISAARGSTWHIQMTPAALQHAVRLVHAAAQRCDNPSRNELMMSLGSLHILLSESVPPLQPLTPPPFDKKVKAGAQVPSAPSPVSGLPQAPSRLTFPPFDSSIIDDLRLRSLNPLGRMRGLVHFIENWEKDAKRLAPGPEHCPYGPGTRMLQRWVDGVLRGALRNRRFDTDVRTMNYAGRAVAFLEISMLNKENRVGDCILLQLHPGQSPILKSNDVWVIERGFNASDIYNQSLSSSSVSKRAILGNHSGHPLTRDRILAIVNERFLGEGPPPEHPKAADAKKKKADAEPGSLSPEQLPPTVAALADWAYGRLGAWWPQHRGPRGLYAASRTSENAIEVGWSAQAGQSFIVKFERDASPGQWTINDVRPLAGPLTQSFIDWRDTFRGRSFSSAVLREITSTRFGLEIPTGETAPLSSTNAALQEGGGGKKKKAAEEKQKKVPPLIPQPTPDQKLKKDAIQKDTKEKNEQEVNVTNLDTYRRYGTREIIIAYLPGQHERALKLGRSLGLEFMEDSRSLEFMLFRWTDAHPISEAMLKAFRQARGILRTVSPNAPMYPGGMRPEVRIETNPAEYNQNPPREITVQYRPHRESFARWFMEQVGWNIVRSDLPNTFIAQPQRGVTRADLERLQKAIEIFESIQPRVSPLEGSTKKDKVEKEQKQKQKEERERNLEFLRTIPKALGTFLTENALQASIQQYSGTLVVSRRGPNNEGRGFLVIGASFDGTMHLSGTAPIPAESPNRSFTVENIRTLISQAFLQDLPEETDAERRGEGPWQMRAHRMRERMIREWTEATRGRNIPLQWSNVQIRSFHVADSEINRSTDFARIAVTWNGKRVIISQGISSRGLPTVRRIWIYQAAQPDLSLPEDSREFTLPNGDFNAADVLRRLDAINKDQASKKKKNEEAEKKEKAAPSDPELAATNKLIEAYNAEPNRLADIRFSRTSGPPLTGGLEVEILSLEKRLPTRIALRGVFRSDELQARQRRFPGSMIIFTIGRVTQQNIEQLLKSLRAMAVYSGSYSLNSALAAGLASIDLAHRTDAFNKTHGNIAHMNFSTANGKAALILTTPEHNRNSVIEVLRSWMLARDIQEREITGRVEFTATLDENYPRPQLNGLVADLTDAITTGGVTENPHVSPLEGSTKKDKVEKEQKQKQEPEAAGAEKLRKEYQMLVKAAEDRIQEAEAANKSGLDAFERIQKNQLAIDAIEAFFTETFYRLSRSSLKAQMENNYVQKRDKDRQRFLKIWEALSKILQVLVEEQNKIINNGIAHPVRITWALNRYETAPDREIIIEYRTGQHERAQKIFRALGCEILRDNRRLGFLLVRFSHEHPVSRTILEELARQGSILRSVYPQIRLTPD